MANSNLTSAKRAKNDEFYTQYADIQKEIEAYLEYDKDTFKGKVVYCNCDDPFESNFFRYFVLNFKRLGLKRLITTSYKPSPIANTQLGLFGDDTTLQPQKGRPKVTANVISLYDVSDFDGDGAFTLEDIKNMLKANKNNEWTPLQGDGDFRSEECVELLKQSDIVVTNPPFSLFRDYLAQLIEHNKKFIVIGNKNSVTHKDFFHYFKNGEMWSGITPWAGGMWFQTTDPNDVDKIIDGVRMKNTPSVWFTNLDHGRRHQPLSLMTMKDNIKFSKHKDLFDKHVYEKYDNYDAIEVPYTDAIPSDYDGIMGVPITFMDKYNPNQFEIVGCSYNYGRPEDWDASINMTGKISGQPIYKRLLIRHRKAAA